MDAQPPDLSTSRFASGVGPRVFLLLAALLWSTAGAAIKLCQLSAWQIAGGRSLVAALVLGAVFPSARRLPSRRVLAVGLAYAATVVLFVLANKRTTAANAIFIQDTAPLYVLLLGPLLLGEKSTRGERAAMPLFGVGLVLFFVGKLEPGALLGNLIALASGVAFAFCIIGLRHLQGEGNQAAAWGNLLAVAVCFPFVASGPSPTALDLGIVFFLGAFQLGLAYALFVKGIQRTPAVEASLLILLEPVLNPLWAYLFAGERPGPWALLGGSIILAATCWRTLAPWWEQRRRPV